MVNSSLTAAFIVLQANSAFVLVERDGTNAPNGVSPEELCELVHIAGELEADPCTGNVSNSAHTEESVGKQGQRAVFRIR